MMLREVTVGDATYKVYIPCAENKKDMKEGDECTLFKEKEQSATVSKPVTFDLDDPMGTSTCVGRQPEKGTWMCSSTPTRMDARGMS